MKIVKKILLFSLAALGILALGGMLTIKIMDDPQPTGKAGEPADEFAQKIMKSVDIAAWDTTRIVAWDFAGQNAHVWDRKRHIASVSWGNKQVLIDLTTKKGKAYKDGEQVPAEDAEKLLKSAWKKWVNDSFWLNPLAKLYDQGTSREIVNLKKGGKGLKITYSSGGVTPGDSYLWIVDENYRPTAWKMWVKIIPVGGMEFSWEGWQQLSTGAWVSNLHKGTFTLKLENIQGATHWSQLYKKDPFAELVQ
ncbi:MAG: hypothetical protein AAGI38_07430 [Bacteroidota bacterium]